jgi:hypothetical protein
MTHELPKTFIEAVVEAKRLWDAIDVVQMDKKLKEEQLKRLFEYVKTTYGEKLYLEFEAEVGPLSILVASSGEAPL